jgi:AcrR family transcriptional regulator
MSPKDAPAPPAMRPAIRKPRADAARNRLVLLDTAKRVFSDKGPAASLDEIAKTAGLGIGTLYRHFPTRDALVEEVYRTETIQLAAAADTLLATQPPVEALRQWMFLVIDYFKTKRIMAAAISAAAGGSAALYAISGSLLNDTVAMLAGRAVQSGAIRMNVEPIDLLRAIYGVVSMSTDPGWEENARQLINILIAGMRVPGANS